MLGIVRYDFPLIGFSRYPICHRLQPVVTGQPNCSSRLQPGLLAGLQTSFMAQAQIEKPG